MAPGADALVVFVDCDFSDLLGVFLEARLSVDIIVAEAQLFLSLLLRTKLFQQVDVVKIEVAWVDREVGRALLVFEIVQEAALEYDAGLRVVS